MGATGGEIAAAVRAHLEPRRGDMVDLLKQLVEIETPSDYPEGLERFASTLEAVFDGLGPFERHGPHRELRIDGGHEAIATRTTEIVQEIASFARACSALTTHPRNA